MMSFPLSFLDLSLWLAATAIILLITSEMISPYYGKTNIRLDRRRLRNLAFGVSMLFLATMAIRIISIILSL